MKVFTALTSHKVIFFVMCAVMFQSLMLVATFVALNHEFWLQIDYILQVYIEPLL